MVKKLPKPLLIMKQTIISLRIKFKRKKKGEMILQVIWQHRILMARRLKVAEGMLTRKKKKNLSKYSMIPQRIAFILTLKIKCIILLWYSYMDSVTLPILSLACSIEPSTPISLRSNAESSCRTPLLGRYQASQIRSNRLGLTMPPAVRSGSSRTERLKMYAVVIIKNNCKNQLINFSKL